MYVLVSSTLSKSKSRLLYDWQSASQPLSQSVCLGRVPLWDLRPDIISCRNVAAWNLLSCIYRAPSLTRGRVCNLLFILRWTLYRTPFSVARCLLSCVIATTDRYYCAYELLWECCCIATYTCRLVLLWIGYRCSQRVRRFDGRLPHYSLGLSEVATSLQVFQSECMDFFPSHAPNMIFKCKKIKLSLYLTN
jgi:hypothetical protein